MAHITFNRPNRKDGGKVPHEWPLGEGVAVHKAKQYIKQCYPDATDLKVVYGTKTRNTDNKQNP
jgi:hypothetical protein